MRDQVRVFGLFAVFLTLSCVAVAQLPPRAVIIHNATIIDGTGKPAQTKMEILLLGGKISEIAPKVQAPQLAVPNIEIDAAGKYVIPGLMDARIALNTSAANAKFRAETGAEQRLAWLHALLAAGVTTVRVVQGDLAEQATWKRWRLLNYFNGPEVLAAGPVFTALDGDPANRYSPIAGYQRELEVAEVGNHDEARDKSRAVAHNGADAFEVVYDKGNEGNPRPRLADAELATIIKEAKDHDLKVYCQVGRDEEVRKAVDAGADVIEGVTEELLSDATLALMKQKNVAFLPMLANQGDFVNLLAPDVMKQYLARPIVQQGLSPVIKKSLAEEKGSLDNLRASLDEELFMMHRDPAAASGDRPKPESKPQAQPQSDQQRAAPQVAGARPTGDVTTLRGLLRKQTERAFENTRRARAAGVLVVVGTSASSPLNFPGASVHRELELLVKAGFTPLAALQAATRDNAIAAGHGQDFGTIEVGRKADLVILNADPLDDIANTQKIDTVIRAGRVIKPAEVDTY